MNTTTPITVLIVDDETPARDLIKHYLRGYPEILIIGEADNGLDAIRMIREYKPHLIFLDIQMPKLTGFEMLELMDHQPEIIFSTAYEQYAIRAFESNAIDYLLKPYSKQRFEKAMQKTLSRIATGVTSKINIQAIQQRDGKSSGYLTRIAVKNQQKIHVIPIQEIDFIEAYGDYVKLHTIKGIFLKEQTMKYLEENLSPQQFLRIHRSFIINVNEVSRIELYEKESYRVYLKNGKSLKASSTGYKALKEIIKL
ncbi:MAG: LytTR family transcriptional regulator DNA-binding domain-containing protein [Dysgonamonadaceae bacterium]|jgi:two-component system LytT family response regulator|nr:LytTR family transcriptional regulator DNA-binding domain-containing protein [Dysgonamonadaceae bacterium]